MEVPADALIKPKTMGQVRRLLQGLLKYAVDKEYISQSPALDLNLKVEKTVGRGAFDKTQIRALLNAANGLQGKNEWKKWIVRLAVFTGARSGEIVQLRREDVKIDSDSGIPYLLITSDAGSLKTANAHRTVPLHSALLDMGFLQFIEDKQDRLFPDRVTSSTVSKWFPTFRAAASIPQKNDYKESLVFHSFRHSLVTFLRGARANDVSVQQIVGHEIMSDESRLQGS